MFKLSDMPIESGSTVRIPAASQRSLVEEFVAMGGVPVMPKPAATVLLLRERADAYAGVEVFMMKRAKTMAFVPEAVVFPGGSVREDDASVVAWAGPSASEWAHRLGIGEEAARAVVVAAARELFEECGVLLAGRDETSFVDTAADSAFWLDARRSLEAHELSFSRLLESCGLALRTDFLHPRSRWVTPEFHPRRYDTFFFAARLPEGQEPHLMTSEATASDWVDPRLVLDEGDAGRLRVVPPTAYNLKTCVHAGSLESLLGEYPAIGRIMFKAAGEGESMTLECVLL